MRIVRDKIRDLWKKFSCILDKKQKKISIVLAILLIIGSFFELLGVSAIIPLIQAVMSPELLMENPYVQPVLQLFHIETAMEMIVGATGLVILVYIVKNAYLTLSNYLRIKYQNQIQKDLSVYILKSYMNRPYTFFLNANSGTILRGITNDISGVYTVLDNLFKIIAESLTAILIIIFIFVTDFILAFGVALLAGSCLVLLVIGFRKKLRKMGDEQREAAQIKYKSANQIIGGIKDIKVTRREDVFLKDYEQAYERQRVADTSYSFAGVCPERIIETVCVCGLLVMVCFRMASGVDINTFMPKLASFAMAAFRILPSISRIVGYVNGVVYFSPTVDSTYQNILEINSYYEQQRCYEEKNISNIDKEKIKFETKVTVKNICWHYPETDKDVLKGLNLTIKKGASIALIGASGAGKTTLADVLLGLLRPQSGTIEVDGQDIYAIPKEWSKMIGYVPQSVYLTGDTVRNNVKFGIDAGKDTDAEVWRALEQAQLKEFVEQLPQKLDTVVGERGVKFSGGQRQRIAIARALYYDPEILVLDEATSALDTETETAVMEAIDSLQKFKTLIIVAHRLTTIQNCDEIYEIGNGVATLKSKEEIFGA